jgi:glycosyltransferase involved in cell wall biosynthesis
MKSRIGIISTNRAVWGGSEELWRLGALRLAAAGHSVVAILSRPDIPNAQIGELKDAGIKVVHAAIDSYSFPSRFWNRFAPDELRITAGVAGRQALRRFSPDFVLINVGYLTELEDFTWALFFRDTGIPYAILEHGASDVDCPNNCTIDRTSQLFLSATRVYFVSEASRALVQQQLGVALPQSAVVRNPVATSGVGVLAWPTTSEAEFSLACPARLCLRDKGLDLLIRLLAKDKWRDRNMAITLYGQGPHSESLKRMAAFLRVPSVRFAGHMTDVAGIWQKNHACVLPSRKEGLPLALVESMWCGRMGIVTDVGGNTEVLRDNITGFVARTPTIEALDEALDRAWQRRNEWEAIGRLAAADIRRLIPENPAHVFADRLVHAFEESRLQTR